MLNKIIILVIFSLLILGCSLTGGTKTDETKSTETAENKPEKPAETERIKEGDTVVARWSGNSFYEGKVESIDGNKIKVKWSDGSNPSDVKKADVYEMPKGDTKPDVKAGDMVLAKISTNTIWNGAEVESVDGNVFKVKAIGSSNTKDLDGNKIIKVSSETAASLKDQAGSTDFLKQAQAKKPGVPKGFKPKKGDKVLAQWATNSWWTGKVNDVNGGKVTVAWDDGSRPSQVDENNVLPDPAKAKSEMPTENQFVLAKPTSGSKWVYAQVAGVKDNNIEIKDSKGNTRTIKEGEFVLLK